MFRPALTAALLVAALASTLAQPAPPQSAPSPAQVAAASPAAAQPPAPAPPPPANPPQGNAAGDLVTVQYPNSDVQDVLHLYETLTGSRLVMDNNVQGKVNIFITKPIPRDEAIRIIEMNLALNGYSLVPAEDGILEVLGAGKNPRAASVPIISDVNELPKGDQVVSFVFKLQYADPTELQQLLSQYFQSPGGTTAILALPKSGSIVATQSASVIRRIADMVDQLDVAPAKVVSEFIPLERADAQKVVDMLRDIFEKNQPGTPGQPAVRPVVGRPPNQPGQPPAPGQPGASVEIDAGTGMTVLSEDALVVGKIKISADVRTNRIHVITRPMNLPFIRQLISEFDANVEFAKPVTRQLRYVSAADMLPVIQEALAEPGAQQGGQIAGSPNQPPQQQPQRRNPNTATTGGYSAGSSSDTATGGSMNISEELSTQAVDTTPKAVTIGNAKIIADQRSNAIIILGNREVVVKVGKILDEMDISSPQVALSTVIGELQLSNGDSFGVNYFSRFNHGNPFSGATTTNNGTGGGLPPGNPATNGGILDPAQLLNFQQLATNAIASPLNTTNVYLAAGNTLSAIVTMLNSTGKFKTISRPTVFTSNNKKAIIANGQEIPIPVNTYSAPTATTVTGTTFASSSSVEYKKVALQLEVVPLINSEKEVSLDILQKLDSLGNNTVVNGNNIPTILTRYIRTNVSAPNCSTIVLGGLIETGDTRNTSGIPILSKIPVIGGLFRNTSKNKTRNELLVLMRPEVSLTKMDLARLRQKNEDKSHFGPEIDQDDCPDCPPNANDEKQIDKNVVLPAPDLPAERTNR